MSEPRSLDEITEHLWRHGLVNTSNAEALIREAYERGRIDCANAVPYDPWGRGTLHPVAPVDQGEVAKTGAIVDDLNELNLINAKNLHASSHGMNGEFGECSRTECVQAREEAWKPRSARSTL
jgi:hypothetical protein